MKTNIFVEVEALLLSNNKFVSDEGRLLKAEIYSDVMAMDETLINILFSNSKVKEAFFVLVGDFFVFDKQKFAWFINSKEFLPDSYTMFTNKIGLTTHGDFISKGNNVVLDFPYKDCVLQGGQSKDDQNRSEILYHEVIANDEIRRMLSPKVFTNTKRYSKNSVENDVTYSKEDNLIFKGNNLIVLSSIAKKFEGKVKCIYIDPPYNTKNATNNTFKYNNTFNHSTWLTFMKNRLDIAKTMLIKDEGVLIIAIDENEQPFLGVLLNEMFPEYDIHMISVVHNPRGIQGKNFSYTNEFLYFVVPKGKKMIQNRKLDPEEIEFSPLRNWGSESLRSDARNCFYPIIVRGGEIVGFGDVCSDSENPPANVMINGDIYVYPVDIKKIERKWRYARDTVEGISHLLQVFNRSDGNIDIELGKDFAQYKTVWIDKKFDSNAYGKQYLDKIVEDKSFTFPKSIHAVYEAIFSVVSNDKEAVILDFFGGSGTTAEAVGMINELDNGNRKFIIVEQMDYIESITTPRIVNTTLKNGAKTIVYTELLEDSISLIEKIVKANQDDIYEIREKMLLDDRIIPYITKVELSDMQNYFEKVSLDDQKRILVTLVDKNKLYINYSEIKDELNEIDPLDLTFNKSFYEVN